MLYEQINPMFRSLDIDHLYHLGLDSSLDLKKIFCKIRYVVMSDSNYDVALFAKEFAKHWYLIQEGAFEFKPIFKTERFNLYKIGPLLIVSHGVGMPSMLICLNEITKLLVHAGCTETVFFKFGEAGGIGVKAGTFIISSEALNTKFEPKFTNIEAGEEVTYPTSFDTNLAQEILNFGTSHGYAIEMGKAIGTYDFYEEQARLDGALDITYTKEERDEYLIQAHLRGIKIINMGALAFSAFCLHLGIPSAMLHVAVVDRLKTDAKISVSQEKLLCKTLIQMLVNYLITDLKNFME